MISRWYQADINYWITHFTCPSHVYSVKKLDKWPSKEFPNKGHHLFNLSSFLYVSFRWVKVNPSSMGFYRVRYTSQLLDKLMPAVRSQQLPSTDRLSLQNDVFALVTFLQIFWLIWNQLFNIRHLREQLPPSTSFVCLNHLKKKLTLLYGMTSTVNSLN